MCLGGGMVDTKDLKSFAFGRAGSSPALGTRIYLRDENRVREMTFVISNTRESAPDGEGGVPP